ncbi:hypothetical protein GTA62_18530 [Roseobacter sp. HKCCD9010]|uniref:hypothetical protein n=1 Tax=unclassified Roseobacter TaxID=196798 RepID=UPI001490D586|nr:MULTISPECIES: hypothetical protein [unclassified Roseobacter]MBF9051916.1 hypothetical protein [Rhodobacterales bacterium HKCCD4356]NNV13909.1 hypothetical protein [Roseobacter sp. HKCCD7357]NNV18081.1 hypothetical protein [Roseobacter sp. HKCCD8768]NNV27541.1 hypothetical protein [Roseobacter sp. HKCCD8192]NNV31807.1 hypothetical protein [Roseobacter sp. HKCCD9061]
MSDLNWSDYALLAIAAAIVLAVIVSLDDVNHWFTVVATDAPQGQTGSAEAAP